MLTHPPSRGISDSDTRGPLSDRHATIRCCGRQHLLEMVGTGSCTGCDQPVENFLYADAETGFRGHAACGDFYDRTHTLDRPTSRSPWR